MINDDLDICENCGEKMIPRNFGMQCPKCGWGWVTSYFEPYETDQTVYSVVIFGNEPNTENIRIVSKITGKNYLKVRELLLLPESVISEEKAPEILKLKQILCDAGISFKITPDFPY